jgi:hypothetical protein
MAGVSLTNPCVESTLCVFEVIRPALQLLLADLDLPAFALFDRLTSLVLICWSNGQPARPAANFLPELGWYELGGAPTDPDRRSAQPCAARTAS